MSGRCEVSAGAARLSGLIVLLALFAPAEAADQNRAFSVAADEFGPVYRLDMEQIQSAADLAAVPGVKIAWDLDGSDPSGWIADARDVDGDAQIELIVAAETDAHRRIVRFDQQRQRVKDWIGNQ